jgi:GTP cyclohydrolase I
MVAARIERVLHSRQRTSEMTRPAAAMATPVSADGIVDVQGSADTRRIPIDKVGIKGIRHPVRVRDRSQGEQHTIASFNMYVDLPQDFKGTHMSRFVEVLNNHEYEITVESFRDMLSEMSVLLEARSGHMDGQAGMSVKVQVPVTSLCPCSKQI